MQRQAAEKGAILPIVLGAILLLVSLAYGGFTILRVVVARQEAQRAADAAVLVATTIIKHDGLPFDGVKQSRAEQVARQNSTLPLEFHWEPVSDTDNRVDITCRVTTKVEAPMFIFSAGKIEAGGIARGSAAQTTVSDVTKKYPKLLLILDFSGSMQRKPGLEGEPGTRDDPNSSYQVLLRVVNMLLNLNFEDMQYGLVIFAGGVIDSVPIALGNLGTMKTHVNEEFTCPSDNESCTTATWSALQKAQEVFAASEGDEARYVILVSDGQPNTGEITTEEGIPKSQAEVAKLWEMGVTMYTIHIVNSPDGETTLKNFMVSISGKPEDRGDEQYYANAKDEASLEERFQEFYGAIACQVGPLDPKPPDPKKVHIFVKEAGGDETVVLDSTESDPKAASPGDLWTHKMDFYTGNYFFYDGDKGVVYVTPPVCDRMLTNHDRLVVRYASPQLTQ